MGGILTPISAIGWIAVAAFLIIILLNQRKQQALEQIQVRRYEDEQQYITATETINRINAQRNRTMSAERKAELKKAFTIDYSQQNNKENH